MIRNILVVITMMSGLIFFLIGSIGVIRLPDLFSRAHSAAKCDTLGAFLCIGSLIIYNGITIVSFKLMICIFFLWITSPTATHLITRSKTIKE